MNNMYAPIHSKSTSSIYQSYTQITRGMNDRSINPYKPYILTSTTSQHQLPSTAKHRQRSDAWRSPAPEDGNSRNEVPPAGVLLVVPSPWSHPCGHVPRDNMGQHGTTRHGALGSGFHQMIFSGGADRGDKSATHDRALAITYAGINTTTCESWRHGSCLGRQTSWFRLTSTRQSLWSNGKSESGFGGGWQLLLDRWRFKLIQLLSNLQFATIDAHRAMDPMRRVSQDAVRKTVVTQS